MIDWLKTFAIILSFKVWKANEIYKMSKTIKILCKEVTTEEKLPFLWGTFPYTDEILPIF